MKHDIDENVKQRLNAELTGNLIACGTMALVIFIATVMNKCSDNKVHDDNQIKIEHSNHADSIQSCTTSAAKNIILYTHNLQHTK